MTGRPKATSTIYGKKQIAYIHLAKKSDCKFTIHFFKWRDKTTKSKINDILCFL